MREVLEEQKEKDSRVNNVMIFNVPEADKGKEPKDQAQDDVTNATHVLHFLDNDFNCPDMKLIRLGRRKADDDTRPRPIRVIIPDVSSKDKVLKNARNLKNYSKFPRIGICQDKTKRELEEDRRLRAELKQKKETTGDDYTIYNKKVVLKSEINMKEKATKQVDATADKVIQVVPED